MKKKYVIILLAVCSLLFSCSKKTDEVVIESVPETEEQISADVEEKEAQNAPLEPGDYRSEDSLLFRLEENYEITVCGGEGSLDIVIPETFEGYPVTSIQNTAFYGHQNIQSVTISGSVKKIGRSAFEQCENLEAVTFSEGLSTISNYAFSGCGKLKEVVFPESLAYIGECAFYECTGLSSVIIPDAVTHIGSNAFGACSNLKKVIARGIFHSEHFFWVRREVIPIGHHDCDEKFFQMALNS